ncbi:MAG TPA: radical SAM protein [Thermoanaerobaculia bacterium]|jgi:MoaA/NifB/PqqE/SkfB family radical SAM enzyme|nr:radical SAM protein [Thermoanaerobaculia bacterium]
MKFTDKLQYLRYLVDKRGMKPVYMILGLTYDCNSFCRTCFNWEQLRKNKEHELSFDELQKTFSSLGDLLFVVMSGGEPFLRRDLPDVCAMLSSQNHVKQITIPTGAITSDLIARQVEASLQRCPDTQIVVNLSIDHVGEKHDWIRGVPGNYEKAKKTYAGLIPLREKYGNLTVNVHTCLCSYNADDLDELFVAVRRDFPAISFHSFEMLRGDQPDKNIQPISTDKYRELLPKLEAYWNTYSHYDSFLKFVKIYTRRLELEILEQETQVKPCHAGRISGVLDARGEVRMCELREAVGNVRDTGYDFGKLWFSPEADAQRKSIKAKECHCTHSCFMSSSLVFDVRTWGAYFASTVVNFLSAA